MRLEHGAWDICSRLMPAFLMLMTGSIIGAMSLCRCFIYIGQWTTAGSQSPSSLPKTVHRYFVSHPMNSVAERAALFQHRGSILINRSSIVFYHHESGNLSYRVHTVIYALQVPVKVCPANRKRKGRCCWRHPCLRIYGSVGRRYLGNDGVRQLWQRFVVVKLGFSEPMSP